MAIEGECADGDEGQALAREYGFEDAYLHTKGAPTIPGVKSGRAGGFGQGEILDQAPPSLVLAGHADYASGPGRDFAGVTDDQLAGLLYARRRLLAWQAWERLMTIGEYIRRRPAPDVGTDEATGMPACWEQGLAGEIHLQLAITRHDADHLLGLAWDLIVKLPGTSARLRDGILDEDKASLISMYCANLTPAEARQAEDIMYTAAGDDIETMTWGMIRDRIAKAVIEVNPDAARKRREAAARERRIETRPEVSGNAMIAGRELPPAAVLAMDQALTARARILRKLGVPGGMNELRVQAFLERWDLAHPETGSTRQAPPAGTGGGLAGQIHLTAPVGTLTEMAGRVGVLRGTGPIDPDLTRELANAAARNPKTGFHFTVTDKDGRPVAHACGRPGPGDPAKPRTRDKPDKSEPPGRARRHAPRESPPLGRDRASETGGFEPEPPGRPRLEIIGRGPPGSLGTWRYTHGDRVIIFEFEDLTGPCDHRHQAAGHDPGKLLRHLTGVLHQTCTNPGCRRPEGQSDYEHAQSWEQGGISCLCNAGPVCRRHHRDKQRPGWKIEGTGTPGWFTWTVPSGRKYLSKPTVYPI